MKIGFIDEREWRNCNMSNPNVYVEEAKADDMRGVMEKSFRHDTSDIEPSNKGKDGSPLAPRGNNAVCMGALGGIIQQTGSRALVCFIGGKLDGAAAQRLWETCWEWGSNLVFHLSSQIHVTKEGHSGMARMVLGPTKEALTTGACLETLLAIVVGTT